MRHLGYQEAVNTAVAAGAYAALLSFGHRAQNCLPPIP
jgi:hypothetical protein